MEQGLGTQLPPVRIHDGPEAQQVANSGNLRAFSFGNHIGFARGEYRPGTLVGDALLAHELTHSLQQRDGRVDGNSISQRGDELEADRFAAVATAHLHAGVAMPRPALPAGSGGLRLRGCIQDCGSKEVDVLAQLAAAEDVTSMVAATNELTDDQLTQARARFAADTERARVIDWVIALRAKNWQALLRLHAGEGAPLHEASGAVAVISSVIREGGARIEVAPASEGGTQASVEEVYGLLDDLMHGRSGFELILRLLTSGRRIRIDASEPAVEALTDTWYPDESPTEMDPNLLVTSEGGHTLPTADQRPGRGTSSIVTVSPQQLRNSVGVVSGEDGNPRLTQLDPVVLLGHELIHALHNAEGTNIAPPTIATLAQMVGTPSHLVRDTVSGLNTKPEELRTITGQTSGFEPPIRADGQPTDVTWPLEFNVEAGITEHDLARERGGELRVSHKGGTYGFTRRGRSGDTPETLVDRHYQARDASGNPTALPRELRERLVRFVRENNPVFVLGRAPTSEFDVQLMHPSHVALHFGVIARREDLAEAASAERLLIR